MKKDLYIDGIHFLTAREAGDVLGYAPDYISRLCREGRLRGRRSGKSWIVEADSLVPFIKLHEAKKTAWHSDLSQKLKAVSTSVQSVASSFEPLPRAHVAPKELHILRGAQRAKKERARSRIRTIASTSASVVLASLLLFSTNTPELALQKLASVMRDSPRMNQVAAAFTLGGLLDSAAHTTYAGINSLACTLTGWCDERPQTIVYVPAQQQKLVASAEPASSGNVYNTNNITNYIQPVVERIREEARTVISGGITEDALNMRLDDLASELKYEGLRQMVNVYDELAGIGGAGFDDIDITDSTWTGGSITGAAISGGSIAGSSLSLSGDATLEDLFATTLTVGSATSTNATSTNMYVSGSFGFGSDTGILRNSAGSVSTLANGVNGQVLKIVGGNLSWSTDISGGGGGGSSFFSTTTDDLALYPADVSDVVIIGDSSTTSVGNILEIAGNSLFRGAVTGYGTITAPRFVATSSVASVLPYASTTALSATMLCLSGDCRGAWTADTSFSTTSAEYWKSVSSFFSTTSSDYYTSVTNFFSTSSANHFSSLGLAFSSTSASYFLSQNQGQAFSTTSANNLLSTYDKGFFFSTTSADYFLSQSNVSGFSTTSADYWKSVSNFFSTTSATYFSSLGLGFSTTSNDYWKTANNFYSTTSSDYWKTQNNFFSTSSSDYYSSLGLAFSTTSANYFLTQNQGAAFSTTSSNYLLSTYDKGFFFSTTSADVWKSVSNFFSTTSADYFSSLGLGFSTTSSDAWKNTRNFFSTTSSDYYSSLGLGFSTTSAN
ncbi:MAG: helix-turn-helix domain-containing protein, partial [Minisyncoccia bacterium]